MTVGQRNFICPWYYWACGVTKEVQCKTMDFFCYFTKTKISQSNCLEVESCLSTVPCLIIRGLNFVLIELNEKVKWKAVSSCEIANYS